MKYVMIICLFCSSVLSISAQIGNDKWNITGELSLPSGRRNVVFKNYLNGLVNVHPKLQYKPFEHWYVAFGPRYMYYTISEFKVPIKMNGGLHVYGGDVELGWTTWFTERYGMEFGTKVGLAHYEFITDLTRENGRQYTNAVYVEPSLSFILAADEAVAYRWIVGYNVAGFDFKSYQVGIEFDNGYTAEDYNKPSQSIMVGFAMTYYFNNKRSDVFLDEE